MSALLAQALALVLIVHAPCPDYMPDWYVSCADQSIVYLAPGLEDDLTHELGHVIDFNLLTDRDRIVFRRITHDPRPWWTEIDPPAERFAEAVRMCARSTRSPDRNTWSYGYRPSIATHRHVCRWLAGLP